MCFRSHLGSTSDVAMSPALFVGALTPAVDPRNERTLKILDAVWTSEENASFGYLLNRDVRPHDLIFMPTSNFFKPLGKYETDEHLVSMRLVLIVKQTSWGVVHRLSGRPKFSVNEDISVQEVRALASLLRNRLPRRVPRVVVF